MALNIDTAHRLGCQHGRIMGLEEARQMVEALPHQTRATRKLLDALDEAADDIRSELNRHDIAALNRSGGD